MISSSGLFYFLESVITFGIACQLFKSFRHSKNSVTLNFFLFFLFLTPTFLCWSLPSLLFPQNHLFLNVGALAGIVLIFIALAFGMRAFAATRFPGFPQNVAYLVTLALGAVVVYLNSTIFGSARMNYAGVVEWHLHPIAIAIYATTIVLLTCFLGVEFFLTAKTSPETRTRSLLSCFATVFIGVGGVLVIMNIPWQVILFGHMILSLGIALIGWMIFFTKKPDKVSG